MAYEINYNDQRFQQVNNEKQTALNEVDKTYGEMIGASDSYYQAQIDASKQWADKQSQLQQEQTDFAIEQIEQQKQQAEKSYTKEQSGAYVDWQKQSNKYGANAEQMASMGMTNTGYSESSQVAMYTAHQNRVATARESYNNAVLNYNNAIKDARLQNNSALAEIAYKSLQQQLELSLQGFQYKNQLILDKANKKIEVENNYYNRYQDVLSQINQENALAEQIRQYNESQAFKEQQLAEEIRQYNEKMAEETRQYNESLALQKAQLEEEKRQYNESLALQKAKSTSSSSSGSSSGSTGGGTTYQGTINNGNAKKVTTKTTAEVEASIKEMMNNGKSKSNVLSYINSMLRDGVITQAQATELKTVYTPRGLTY